MILSSADILRVLGGSEIIRLSAKLKIVDGKPPLSGAEGIYICIDRFPELNEFQATWTIYIESDEEDDLVVAEIQRLLPSVQVKPGLMTTVTTTDFLSENTQRPPAAEKTKKTEVDLVKYEERFQALVEDVQDRMLLVSSGRPGRDGKDGRDGYNGRDGKDVDATQVELFDLKDVDQSILPMEKGQVLTWDGAKWTNLYVRQNMSAGGAAGGGGGTNDPDDGLGGVVSSFWKFDDHEDGRQSDGHFSVNSHQGKTDWSLTTEVYVAYKNNAGNNTKNYLLQLIKPGQYLYIQRNDRPDAYAMFLVDAVPVDADPKGASVEVTFVAQGPDISEITKDKTCGLTFALISGSGGSGGATTLAELTDTNTVGAANADLLVYRSGVWTAETPASTCDYTVSDGGDFDSGTAQETGCDGIGIVGVVELDDLSDVDLTTTSPADNDLLVYDQTSGNWLPTPNTVRNLADFDGTNLEEGATIVWDAVAQIFKQAQHGADGITSAAYKYKNTLTGDPSNGHIALDNADPTLATEIRVHKTTTNGVDLSAVFNMGLGLAQGLYIQRKDDASEAHAYRTTGSAVDQGDYIAVPIEHAGGTGTFTNNKIMVIGVYARSEAHKISPVPAPLSSTADGTEGEVRYDANYFYICIAANTWRRFTLETW